MNAKISDAVTLLWELRAHFEEKEETSRLDRDEFDLLEQIRAFTRLTLHQNDPARKLIPNGQASRDRIVAAKLDLRS
jgi:hypothetical protein